MNKSAMIAFIDYYVDHNWVLREVLLSFDEIDGCMFSYFES